MLRSLVDEVVRRRMWPIPLVALLIAIAAPVLFMKSAPAGAPAATEVPALVAPGELPPKAKKLLESSDKAVVGSKRSTRKAQDPFAPPSGSESDASGSASAASAGTGKTSSAASVPVVIENADGTTSKATLAPSTGTSSKSTTSKSTKTPVSKTRSKSRTPKITVPATSTSSASGTSKVTYVDVQFGERMGTMTRYRVPRLQTFRAGGMVAAMLVGYSAVRNAAVFAVAPSTTVSGVTCREVKGVCRYVDLPSGSHARLSLYGEDGSKVSRRLDVVGIRHLPKVTGSTASARMTTLPAAKCLLKSLLALPATAPSISTDACA